MSENRLNAYLKAKGVEPKGDDTDYVIGTGYTQATAEWAEEHEDLFKWMIPGGAAVAANMNNSDDTTGSVTGSDTPTGSVTGSDTPTGSVTGSDVTGSVTGSDDDSGDDDDSDPTGSVTGGDSSTVDPETIVSDPEEISSLTEEEAANTTVNASTPEAVSAINGNTYYNNININGE